MTSPNLYCGTTGYSYPEWRGGVYPAQTRPEEMLNQYAGTFPAVEIDASFYRFPAQATLEEWVRRTPDTFRVALKVHRAITYDRKPKDQARMLADFVQRARILGSRMGPFLLAFPPYRSLDVSFMVQLLQGLPRDCMAACLFRHGSWYVPEAAATLYERGITFCVNNGDDYPAATLDPKSPFAHLRLQAAEYSREDLQGWAKQLEPFLRASKPVYVFFQHRATAPANALIMMDLLGIKAPSLAHGQTARDA